MCDVVTFHSLLVCLHCLIVVSHVHWILKFIIWSGFLVLIVKYRYFFYLTVFFKPEIMFSLYITKLQWQCKISQISVFSFLKDLFYRPITLGCQVKFHKEWVRLVSTILTLIETKLNEQNIEILHIYSIITLLIKKCFKGIDFLPQTLIV